MTTSFKQIQVGIVGNKPSLFQLNTSESLSTVEAAGFLNNIQGSTEAKAAQGDMVISKVGTDQRLTIFEANVAAGVITLDDIAGGGGSGGNFEYLNTFFVATNGDDGDTGKSMNTPKQTIAGAIAAFTTPTTPSIIVLLDNGSYAEDLSLTAGQSVTIVGDGASLVAATPGVPAITNAASNVYVILDSIAGNAGPAIANTTLMDVRCRTISGNISNIGNLTFTVMDLDVDRFTGDIITGGCTIRATTNLFTGDITSTGTANSRLSLNVQHLDGTLNTNNCIVNIDCEGTTGLTWTIAETSTNTGNLIGFLGVGPFGFSIDSSSLNGNPKGFFDGAAYSGSAVTPSVFVSQEVGDDTTGNGSEDKPWATISKAITEVGAPATPTIIRVMDGATYAETLTFVNPNVLLVAPAATISQSGTADTIVISTTSPSSFLADVGVLLNTGTGKLISHTSTSSYLIVAAVFSGDIDMGDAGGTLRSLSLLISDMTVNNGDIAYVGGDRTGTDTVGGAGTIKGVSIGECRGVEWDMTAGGTIGSDGGGAQSFTLWPPTAANGSIVHNATDSGGVNVLTITNAVQSGSFTATYPDYAGSWNFQATSVTPDLGANFITADVTAASGALATAGTVALLPATAAATYRFRELFLNGGGTNFSGGGGDRDLAITDGTTVYSVIPAAIIQALLNAGWGEHDTGLASTPVPYPAAAAINALTQAGVNVVMQYSGGTADYAAGSLVMSAVYERIS